MATSQQPFLTARIEPSDLANVDKITPFYVSPELWPVIMTKYDVAVANEKSFAELRKNTMGVLGVDEELKRLSGAPFDVAPRSIPFSMNLHNLHSIQNSILAASDMDKQSKLNRDHEDIVHELNSRRSTIYSYAAQNIGVSSMAHANPPFVPVASTSAGRSTIRGGNF
jgi:hypothetical protein